MINYLTKGPKMNGTKLACLGAVISICLSGVLSTPALADDGERVKYTISKRFDSIGRGQTVRMNTDWITIDGEGEMFAASAGIFDCENNLDGLLTIDKFTTTLRVLNSSNVEVKREVISGRSSGTIKVYDLPAGRYRAFAAFKLSKQGYYCKGKMRINGYEE
jgi:hypothetical protein